MENKLKLYFLLSISALTFPISLPAITLDELSKDSVPEILPYKKVGDEELKLMIVKPKDWKKEDKRTALLLVHGGRAEKGNPELLLPHARYFASRGAVSFSVQYRYLESPKNKEEFENGPSVADSIRDVKSAIRFVRGNAGELGINYDKIIVSGDSAGGRIALSTGTITDVDDPADNLSISPVPNAIIACSGATDLTQKRWLSIIKDSPEPDEASPSDHQLSDAEAKLERAKRFSPLFHVNKNMPPVLIMQGQEDSVVTPEESEKFYKELLKCEVTAKYIVFENAKHAFIRTDSSATDDEVVKAIRTVDEFLIENKFLQGVPNIEPPKYEQAAKKLLVHYKFSSIANKSTDNEIVKGPPAVIRNCESVPDPRGKVLRLPNRKSLLTVENLPMGFDTTITFWIKTLIGSGTIMKRDHNFGFELQFTGRGGLKLSSSRFNIEVPHGTLPDGKWAFVAMVFEKDMVSLYINDKIFTADNTSGQRQKGDKIIVGGFSGWLDDFRIYNYPFASHDILKLYESEKE